jgi:hypothetical protein
VEIDAAGGELAHCGATLVVPAGAVARPTTFRIAAIEPPAAAPFEHELASPVFEISPEMPELADLVSLTLEHTAADSRFKLARFDETLGGFAWIEACQVTDTTIQQYLGALGTWTVLRDVNDYPDSTSGLGDGTIELSFLGEDVVYDLDDPGGYGIYQASENGDRNVTIIGHREVAGGLEQIRIDFSALAAGGGSLIQIEWISTVIGGGYSYIDGLIGSGGEIMLEETVEGRLVATLSANVQGGNPPGEEPLAATFDVSVEAYAFPPELVCPGGEEAR